MLSEKASLRSEKGGIHLSNYRVIPISHFFHPLIHSLILTLYTFTECPLNTSQCENA